MEDEKGDEKQNPFEEWPSCTYPWEYVEQRRKSRLFNEGTFLYKTKVRPVGEIRTEFEARPMSEMLKDFFTRNGNPKLYRLGKFADLWIFWSVTQGMYRMNRLKQMFVFQGESPDILRLKHGSENYWYHVSEHRGFQICHEITDTCNLLHSQILQKFVRCNNRTMYRKNSLVNFRKIAEFVQFQTYRSNEHKQRRWTYQGRKRGGNQPTLKAAPSIPHPQHSVHRILTDYHMWLPTVRKVNPTK